MNANAIQPGLEYACADYPSRNQTYYPHVERVRVLHVYRLEHPYKRRKVSLVECQSVDVDGNYSEEVRTVDARQIVYTWAEHLIEKERYDAQINEQAERRRKAQEERDRAFEVERNARIAKEQKLRDYVSKNLNISPAAIQLSYGSVSIPRHYIEEVLLHEDANERASEESVNH